MPEGDSLVLWVTHEHHDLGFSFLQPVLEDVEREMRVDEPGRGYLLQDLHKSWGLPILELHQGESLHDVLLGGRLDISIVTDQPYDLLCPRVA